MESGPLTIEVPIALRNAPQLPVINIPGSDAAKYVFPTKTLAGSTFRQGPPALFTPANTGKAVIWRTSADEPDVLTLHYVTLSGDQRQNELDIRFAHPILPSVACIDGGPLAELAVISADGVLTVFNLDYSSQHGSLQQAVASESARITVPLSSHFDRLGAPTSLLYIGDYCCIGTAEGQILCIRRGDYDVGAAFELKGGSSGYGFQSVLGGLFHKPTAPAVQQLVELNFMGKSLLCSIHQGCVFKMWDLANRRLLHSTSLLPDAVAAGYVAEIARIAMEPIDTSTSILMVYFKSKESDGDGGQLITYEIFLEDRDGAYKVQLEAGPRLQSALQGLTDITLQHVSPHTVGAWLLFDNSRGGADNNNKKLVCLPVTFTDGEIQPVCEARLLDEQLAEACAVNNPTVALIQQEAWQIIQERAADNDVHLPATIIAEAYIDALIAPGVLSRHALHAAIVSSTGCTAEVANVVLECELDELPLRLYSVLTQAGKNVESITDWNDFLAEYIDQWRARHQPIALCGQTTSKGDQVVLLVRGNGTLSLLRTGVAPELALSGFLPSSRSSSLPGEQQAKEVKNVVDAGRALAAAAGGRPVMRLLWACAKHGISFHSVLMPALLKILTAGSTKQQGSSARNINGLTGQQVATLRSQWRAVCRKLPLQLASCDIPSHGFASWVMKLLSSLSQYQWMEHRPTRSYLESLTSPLIQATLATVNQMSWAQTELLLQVQLLCTWVIALNTLGTSQIDSFEKDDLVSRVLPKASNMLQASMVAHWSAVTPVSPTGTESIGGIVDPEQLVLSLNLGDGVKRARMTSLTGARACQLSFGRGYQESGHVVRDFMDLEMVINSFSRWMMGVPEIEATSNVHLGDLPIQPLLRTLPLAFELFRHKQSDALTSLLRLLQVFGERNDPRLLFFQACSKAQNIRYAEDDEERRKLEEESVALFFRTATILAHPIFFIDEVASIKAYVQQLHKDTTQRDLVDEGPAAAKMQYFETLASLFERIGCPAGASRFAQAAAYEVKAALPGDERGEERAKREGRLWVHVFAHNLEAGAYEAAYAALLTNPVNELQVECLHRLVNELCVRDQAGLLCRLPFAHTLSLKKSGHQLWVPMLDEATAALERRAANLDLSERPQPYKVLYAFHMSRHNVQGAASAMLAYARRLQQERAGQLAAIKEAEHAFGVAAAALSLLEPEQAWVVDTIQKGDGSSDLPTAIAAVNTFTSTESPAVLTVEDIKREKAVARALAALGDASPTQHVLTGSSLDDVFESLVTLGLYDDAFALADAVYVGTQLAEAREMVVAALAERCLKLQTRCSGTYRHGSRSKVLSVQQLASRRQGDDTEMDEADDDEVETVNDQPLASLFDGKQSAAIAAKCSWLRLARQLKKYEAQQTDGYRLRLVAAEAVLAKQPKFTLPPWLVAPFIPPPIPAPASVLGLQQPLSPRQNEPATAEYHSADFTGLIRLYMKYNRLHDAASVAAKHLALITNKVPSVAMPKAAVVNYSHGLLDELVARLEAIDATEIQEELVGLLQKERNAADQQTQVIDKIYAA